MICTMSRNTDPPLPSVRSSFLGFLPWIPSCGCKGYTRTHGTHAALAAPVRVSACVRACSWWTAAFGWVLGLFVSSSLRLFVSSSLSLFASQPSLFSSARLLALLPLLNIPTHFRHCTTPWGTSSTSGQTRPPLFQGAEAHE